MLEFEPLGEREFAGNASRAGGSASCCGLIPGRCSFVEAFLMGRSRGSASSLAKLLHGVSAPVYVVDDERRIVFCNPAFCDWRGAEAEQLLGVRCDYCTPAELSGAEAAAFGLCPPPEVFAGVPTTALVSRIDLDGQLVERRAHFSPLGSAGAGQVSVLAVLETTDFVASRQPAPDAEASAAELHQKIARLRRKLAGVARIDQLLGEQPAVILARNQAGVAAESQANVLIWGQRGAGREHLARAIHYHRSADSPPALIPLACEVLSAELLSSTFAAQAGKKTPPVNGARTLLLTEIDQMPAAAQAQLADLLKGGAGERVIATASQPLVALAQEGKFHAELAGRISTLAIHLPPLAERRPDLPLLAQAMLEANNAQGAKQVGGFSPEALDRLCVYHWPGNLNELAEMVRQAHEQAAGQQVLPEELPPRLRAAEHAARFPAKAAAPIVLEEFLGRVERELIERALRRCQGNKAKAAKLLGLTRPRLYRRLVQLGLEPKPKDDP